MRRPVRFADTVPRRGSGRSVTLTVAPSTAGDHNTGNPTVRTLGMVELEPIGTVRTPIERTEDAPRQGTNDSIEGTIEIDEGYEPGLAGIEPGDSVLVIWFADSADRSLLRLDRREERGVFASRSPARPNPIALTVVEVLAVEGPSIAVRGVDMLDGTPILDLKVPLD